MKKFIIVVNNVIRTADGIKKAPDVAYEIIPVQNLVKAYRLICGEKRWIIAYVWRCPVTGYDREFFEELPLCEFFKRLRELKERLK